VTNHPKPVAPERPRQVAVIGAGYVGIPTAALLAHYGHQVVLAERDQRRLSVLQAGRSPIVEAGLDELLAEGVANGNLRFTDGAAAACRDADVIFLCVPTPQDDDGSADLSYVLAAAEEISASLKSGAIVVDKSTVPVGTAKLVAERLGRSDVTVVSNPEFLREGTAVADSLAPDRIVVGADRPEDAMAVAELFAASKAPLVLTDTATAETTKYVANAFLATKLSFINAVAGLCEAVGADVRDLIVGLGYDKRIGFEFMNPGPGWGGSCLPKDTAALISIGRDHGFDFALLRGAVQTNEDQIRTIVAKVSHAAGGLEGRRVGVWGLTFKANTDDRRCSPATDVCGRLVAAGAEVVAYDPTVAPGTEAADLEGITVVGDAYEAVRGAEVAVLLTEWPEFRSIDLAKVAEVLAAPAVVDARNLFDPAAVRRNGLRYSGIGRT